MDLYNSHLTGYQSGKSQITRSSAQNRAASEVSRKKASTSADQGKPLELREGQILRGQVLDHRYNEVTIQLEPGKETLTASLSGDIPLSIGQEAVFTVTGEASGSYVLKYLPENLTSQEVATIGKALTASGFPLTDRNKAIVAELLANRLPIDKQTLQALLRISIVNQKASPQTLVLMYKNNLPLTTANIKQFEAYQSGTHQLINDIRTISHNLSELLTLPTLDSHLESTTANPPVTRALQTNQSLIDILYPVSGTSAQEPSTLNSIFSQSQLKHLSALFEQHNMDNPSFSEVLSADLTGKIQSGTLSISEAIALFDPMMEVHSKQELSPQISHGASQNVFTEDDFKLFSKLLEEYETDPNSSPQLLKILNNQARAIFTELLKGSPDSPHAQILRDQITKGSITMKELFTLLQEQLPKLDPSAAAALIQSPEYTKLFEAAFLRKWTVPSNKFADKSSVTNLLKELSEDLNQLHRLMEDQPSLSDSDRLQHPVQNLRENLQFMKDLNQAFTYLQLPVQFKNDAAHTELYIFSKKKNQKNDSEPLSVLLHLEMLNLGSLNVYLQMFGNKQLQADFYVENKETVALIKDHLDSLTAALQEKTYSLKATVTDTYNKPNFSKDFIEQSSQDSNVKRYTFDIRT